MRIPRAKLEIIKNALSSITDSAALTIIRTARSIPAKEGMDFSTALFDRHGRQIAAGLTLPLQLAALPEMMEVILKRFDGMIHPGDVFLSNDPFDGGTHLPDLIMFVPVFHDEDLLGFGAVLLHMVDIGGRFPGGISVESRTLYEEGLRIPPVKLVEQGNVNQFLYELIKCNVRVPDDVVGDIEGMIAACDRMARDFVSMSQQYGYEPLQEALNELLDVAEDATRREIGKIEDGVYHFVDYVDDDIASGQPIRVACTVEVEGTDVRVDLSGTSPQVESALNLLPSTAKAAIYTAFRVLFDSEIASNQGFVRPFSIELPPRSVVNPEHPAACGARGVVAYRVFDAVMGALGMSQPDLVPAAGEGGVAMASFSGVRTDGSSFVFLDGFTCSWGAQCDRDGQDGVSHFAANLRLTSAEALEVEFPIQVERRTLVTDSGGTGQYRGGLAYRTEWRALVDDVTVSVRADRGDNNRPWGLHGGMPGTGARCVLNPGEAKERQLPLLHTMIMKRDDVLQLTLAGGGGWGPARARSQDAILADLRNRRISRQQAIEVYGLDPQLSTELIR